MAAGSRRPAGGPDARPIGPVSGGKQISRRTVRAAPPPDRMQMGRRAAVVTALVADILICAGRSQAREKEKPAAAAAAFPKRNTLEPPLNQREPARWRKGRNICADFISQLHPLQVGRREHGLEWRRRPAPCCCVIASCFSPPFTFCLSLGTG